MQGLPQPDVNLHQQRYVRYRSWQEGAHAGRCPTMHQACFYHGKRAGVIPPCGNETAQPRAPLYSAFAKSCVRAAWRFPWAAPSTF